MTTKNADEEDLKQELTNLHFLQSRLCLKINELKALRHSIKDALALSQATQEEYNKLEIELESLASLRKESEASRRAFHVKFAAKHSQEAVDVYKTVDENINAALNIQVNVEMLKRKVHSQLAGKGKKKEIQDTNVIMNKANKKEEESEDNQNDENMSESDSSESAEEETSRVMSLRLLLPLCLVLVVTFYFCLGVVIQLVQDNRRDNENGSLFWVLTCGLKIV